MTTRNCAGLVAAALMTIPSALAAAPFVERHSAWTAMGRDDVCFAVTEDLGGSGAALTLLYFPTRSYATVSSASWLEVPGTWEAGQGVLELVFGTDAPETLPAQIEGVAIYLTDESGASFTGLETALKSKTATMEIAAAGQRDLALRDGSGTEIAAFSLHGVADALAAASACAATL